MIPPSKEFDGHRDAACSSVNLDSVTVLVLGFIADWRSYYMLLMHKNHCQFSKYNCAKINLKILVYITNTKTKYVCVLDLFKKLSHLQWMNFF